MLVAMRQAMLGALLDASDVSMPRPDPTRPVPLRAREIPTAHTEVRFRPENTIESFDVNDARATRVTDRKETRMNPAPTLLPKQARAHQGNPNITVWCAKCEERTIPLARTGRCAWCDEQIVGPVEPKRGRGGHRNWTVQQVGAAAAFRRAGMSYSNVAIAMDVLFAVRLDGTRWSELVRRHAGVPADPRGNSFTAATS